MRNYRYNHRLGIAGIEDGSSEMKVYTLLQSPGIKKAALNAYAGARYSRSEKSIFDILEEVLNTAIGKNVAMDEHASERIEQIVTSYNHPSVAGMSHNFICMENIPMITIMRFFYLNAIQDGQERSTRFQDFSSPNFWISPANGNNGEYQDILYDFIDAYNDLKDETYGTLKDAFAIDVNNKLEEGALQARTFDTLRHFIPMGMRTSGCAVMNSREWSRYIGMLKGSDQLAEQELGILLYDLMVGTEELTVQGYVPESDVLIRHADANDSSFRTINEIKDFLLDACDIDWAKVPTATSVKGAFQTSAAVSFADHIAMLGGNRSFIGIEHAIPKKFFTHAGQVIFKEHYHYNQVGTVLQTGAIGIKDVTDIGALKDFNRHRSLERFIPFCENTVEISVLLENTYGLCAYLYQPGFEKLRAKYEERFDAIYAKMRMLAKLKVYTLEEMRYLLPHAHQTPYNMYGSLDDLLYTEMLRVRPGGHINYRLETWEWRESMVKSSIFGLPELWESIPIAKPSALSREEFVSRS